MEVSHIGDSGYICAIWGWIIGFTTKTMGNGKYMGKKTMIYNHNAKYMGNQ
jgi:hypothetical protein